MLSLLGVLLAAYVTLALCVLFFADHLIFQPPPPGYADTPETLKLPSTDGARISAIHLPNADAPFTILFSHGNAEDIGYALPYLRELRAAGFSVFAYDYQGYGTSQGRASEQRAYDDAQAAYDYLVNQLKLPPERILIMGRSLGGAVAIDLASRRPSAGLIIESSFITAFRVLSRVALLPWDKFRSLEKLKQVRAPVLVIHGEDDEVIGISHGRRLYEAAREPKRHLWVEKAGHNDLFLVAGERYVSALRDFAELVKQHQAKAAGADD